MEAFHWLETWIRYLSPNLYFQAGILLALSLLAAKLANLILVRILQRWSEKTKTDVDDRLVDILHGPVFLTFVLLGLGFATIRVQLPDTPTKVTLAALQTIGVAIWLAFSFRFSRILLDILGRRQNASTLLQARTLPLIDNVIKIVLVGLATYFVFLAWKIDLTAWVASAGILGIAVGFAAKDSLANIISGISILADSPYKVGDFVVLDTGEGGQIGHIGIRSTRMLTRDDIEITIPNSVMANSKVINESGGPNPKRRIRIRVSVAYGSDIDKVRALLLEAAQSHS
jgi:small-conductance mechanosensitive channel